MDVGDVGHEIGGLTRLAAADNHTPGPSPEVASCWTSYYFVTGHITKSGSVNTNDLSRINQEAKKARVSIMY